MLCESRVTWGWGGNVRCAKSIQEEDVVPLYMASPYKAFGGCAIVTKTHRGFKVTPRRLFDPRYRIFPQDVIRHKQLAHFATQVPLASLVDKLRFTRAVKPRWGLAVHRAIRAIDRRDFIKIVRLLRSSTIISLREQSL